MRKVLIGAVAFSIIGVAAMQGAAGAQQDRSRSRIPTFKVESSCESAAARSSVPLGSPVNTAEICIRKEMEARDQMTKEWDKFSVADRSYCVPLSMQGGTPTYTELLTCLELAREARNLREKDGDALGVTTGMGSSTSKTGRSR